MRPALAPSWRRHGDVDPGKRYRRRSAALRPSPATLMLAKCSMHARRWPARLPSACCRMARRASASAPRTTGPGPAARCCCRWRRQLVRRALRSWPGPCMRPTLAPSRRRHGDVDPGERADVDQVDVVAVAGDVDAGQVLDARAALASAIAVGVLQDGQQGECIGAAHYRAGRALGAAAGGGRQLVRRVLRSWPWRHRGAGMAMWILGSVRTSTRSMMRPWPATLARCSTCAVLAGVLQRPRERVHRRRALLGRARPPGATTGGGRRLVCRASGPGQGCACAPP